MIQLAWLRPRPQLAGGVACLRSAETVRSVLVTVLKLELRRFRPGCGAAGVKQRRLTLDDAPVPRRGVVPRPVWNLRSRG